MSEGRWDRAQQLFEAALDRPAQARRAYLEGACAGDAALVDEVCALLEADERSDAALDDTVGAFIPPPPPDLVPGSELEDYRIEAKIGEGGFGSVYRARHGVIGKQAAIKVLHPSTRPRACSPSASSTRPAPSTRSGTPTSSTSSGSAEPPTGGSTT